MTNSIDINGITIDTLEEITTELEDGFKEIYGDDIILDSNSPDGQLLNIFAQAIRDLREFEVSIFNNFDPDQAIGVNLDARAVLNGLERRGGTYSITAVEVTTDRSLNLIGLDGEEEPPTNTFTIQDDEGNQFYLETSQTITGAGTYDYNFRAVEAGAVQIVPNTITTIVLITLGVLSINNPSAPSITGIDQETDSEFRQRIQRITAINSVGFFESMYSNLLDINEVDDLLLLENKTPSTDSDGIPAHSYWIIVSGGSDEDIANTIYTYRSAGSGLKGSESVDITQIDGSVFEVNFDRAISEDLYIQFDVSDIITGNPVDTIYLAQQIVANISYDIGATANKTDIEAYVKNIYPNVYVKDCKVSNDDITYSDTLDTTTKQYKFSLSTANINITNI